MQTTRGQKMSSIFVAVLLFFVTTARSAVGTFVIPHANFAILSTKAIKAKSASVASEPKALLMVASWYGKKFQGRKTSSGEMFDLNKLTAAHKTLPLGSIVKLTVPHTAHSVVVRINDRGPWIKGRDFDLSEAAAIKLGIHEQGCAAVEMALIK
jgi:rare lipoprotein A (peptidoglycan hydrolase)